MKYSQFNSVVPFEENFALYNSFVQKVIFLASELKDMLCAAQAEGIDVLEQYHPTFYRYLSENGFIVEDTTDETEKVKALSREIDNNDTSFLLTINPTMNCNFKCWYCYETHIKQSRLEDSTSIRIRKFMARIFDDPRINAFSLSFFGGEPLLQFKKDVVPIIDAYLEKCHSQGISPNISFTTNGYLVNDEFIEYFRENGVTCALQITLDGYAEAHDQVRFVSAQKGSYERIVNNIKLLISHDFFVRLRVNYTDKNIHDSYKIAGEFADIPQEIKDKNLLLDFHRVWQNAQEADIRKEVEEVIELAKKEHIRVSSGEAPNNVAESCYADKRNSVVINYNGDIYKCTARDFTKAGREGYIDADGNLVWENDSLEQRMNIKFRNKPCLSCRLLPICNGGCSQHALEHQNDDYCIYDGDEGEKDRIVKLKVTEIIEQNSLSL